MAKTAGATSFVAITLSELNSMFQPEAKIFVSRRQLEALGLTGERVYIKNGASAPATPAAAETPIPVAKIVPQIGEE